VQVVRRARTVVGLWEDGELVLDNYLTRTRAVVTPALLQLIHELPGPLPLTALDRELRHLGSGDAARRLVERSIYLPVEGPDAQREELLTATWTWGEPARWFHFGTRDTPLEPDMAPPRRRRARPGATPPPPTLSLAGDTVDLPAAPALDQPGAGLGPVLARRRTARAWSGAALSAEDLAAILHWTWGTQRYVEDAPNGPYQLRTSPSGGARHSIEAYVAVLRVDGIEPGLYHYDSAARALTVLRREDHDEIAPRVTRWFAGQSGPAEAAAVFVMVAHVARSMWQFHQPHAYRVLLVDAGHLGQTFHLVATALGLGPFTATSLAHTAIEADLGLDGVSALPLYAAAVGHPVEAAAQGAGPPDGEAAPAPAPPAP
jgi:SagB-type dehydrogenase family enzyme